VAALLASGLAAWAFWPVVPEQPEVFALLDLQSSPPRILPDRTASEGEEGQRPYLKRQEALLRSRLVLYAALRTPEVTALPSIAQLSDPVVWLEERLQIDFPTAPEIMRVGLSGGPPEELAIFLNAIIKAYFDEVVLKEQNRKRERYIQIKDIAKRFEDKLKSIRQSIRTLQEQVGPVDKNLGELHQQIAQLELDQTQRELAKVRLELLTLRVQSEAVKAGTSPDAVILDKDQNKAMLQAPLLKERMTFLTRLEKTLAANAERLAKKAKKEKIQILDAIDFQREIEDKEGMVKDLRKRATALEIELEAPSPISLIQTPIVNPKKRRQFWALFGDDR
jgi:hypothetical protein